MPCDGSTITGKKDMFFIAATVHNEMHNPFFYGKSFFHFEKLYLQLQSSYPKLQYHKVSYIVLQ